MGNPVTSGRFTPYPKTPKRPPSFSFPIALAAYLTAVSLLAVAVGHATSYHQFYVLDDTYIHLAVAKDLYLYGSYGVSPHTFSAADSSIVWPGLIAAFFYAIGVNTLVPLLLNILASIALLYVCARLYTHAQPEAPRALQIALPLTMVFFVPLTVMPFEGMEHVLQALTCLCFLYFASQERQKTALLCLLAALCTATRYEGLYLVFAACLLLFWRRRVFDSFAIGLSALAPICAFGLWSQAHGSHFVPNSLLLKAMAPGKVNLLAFAFAPYQGIFCRYSWQIGLAELFVANLAVVLFGVVSKRTASMLWLFLGTALLHAEFSRLGWVYRYEAYLIALGLFVLFNAAAEMTFRIPVPRSLAYPEFATGAVLLVAIPLIYRATITMAQVPGAAQAVYFQQYQMGHFLESYYASNSVAANDIGIISFLGHPDLLDLYGLSSVEVANLKMKNAYTTGEIAKLAREHNVPVAVAYPSWFTGESALPSEWIPVRSWRIPQALFLGGTSVTFYAVDPSEADRLKRNLTNYETLMPKQIQTY